MSTLDYITQKFDLNLKDKFVIEIPNFGRNNLAELFSELGFRTGAEIGVQDGTYSEIICKANPSLILYSVDPWEVYSGYRDHTDQNEMAEVYKQAITRLSVYKNCVMVRKMSMDALKDFEDDSLDFVYIDANHELPWIIDDICGWMKKVRSGGIISGHDYYATKVFDTKMHVKYAVNCVVQSYRIKPLFILGSGATKQPGIIRDEPRSWMWIR